MNEYEDNPYAGPEIPPKKVKKRRQIVRRTALQLLGVAFVLVLGRIVYGVLSEWSDARYIVDWLAVLACVGIAFFVVQTLGDVEEN